MTILGATISMIGRPAVTAPSLHHGRASGAQHGEHHREDTLGWRTQLDGKTITLRQSVSSLPYLNIQKILDRSLPVATYLTTNGDVEARSKPQPASGAHHRSGLAVSRHQDDLGH